MDEQTLREAVRSVMKESNGDIAAQVVHRLATNPPPFWVAGEKHYTDHLRLDWWFKTADIVAKAAIVVIVSAVVVGIAYMIVEPFKVP